MLSNPFAFIPFKEQAWAEGFLKGLASVSSPAPGDTISEVDFDAFNEGVSTGADVAVNGTPFDVPCVAAQEGAPAHTAGLLVDFGHVAHGVFHAASVRTLAAAAGGFAAILVAIVTLGSSATHALPPDEVLPGLGEEFTGTLISLGAGSLEFFAGVSLDTLSPDCTMLMSPVFLTLEQAQQAASAAGRPEGWLVVSWRTDQSNSFRIAAHSVPE